MTMPPMRIEIKEERMDYPIVISEIRRKSNYDRNQQNKLRVRNFKRK